MEKDAIYQVLVEFYDRVYQDVMIGYLFAPFDQEVLIEKQLEFTLSLFGKAVYTGKGLGEAHKPLKLRSGHLRRRQVILAQVLVDLQVPDEFKSHWLKSEERVLNPVLGSAPSCVSPL